MAKDVIITPASGLIEFLSATGNTDATIQLDDNGNLNFASPNGDISIGDTTSDVYIGDGVNNVDIVFEQNGAIRALAGKTLTIGQSNSSVAIVALSATLNGNAILTNADSVSSATPTFDSALSSSATEIFRFDKTEYRGGKALITLNDSPNFKIEELLFIHDGTDVSINRPLSQGYFLQDYVVGNYTGFDVEVTMGTVIVTYSANIVGDNVIVYGAAEVGSPTAKGSINYISI